MATTRKNRYPRTIGCLVMVIVLVGAIGVGVWAFRDHHDLTPRTLWTRCHATASGQSVTVRPEQAHYAAIIAGLSVQRGMVPRAATIALATAYQESDIRNLDHGDRDSVGLFQQRPSQGWGTVDQIMDPYYSTHAFYDGLEKIPGWETGDINDTAQAVQRSGFPEAYRKHEGNARILASVLTGHSPAALSCAVVEPAPADPDGFIDSARASLGELPLTPAAGDAAASTPDTVTLTGGHAALQWAVAHHAVANAAELGITSVQVDDQVWQATGETQPWQPIADLDVDEGHRPTGPVDGVVVSF